MSTNDQTKKEAERFWELAIAAKGGREKLHSLKNVQMSSMGSLRWKFKKIQTRNEFLIVYPDRYWQWDDQRPSNFGLQMKMYNLTLGKKYVAVEDNEIVELVPFEKTEFVERQLSALIWLTLDNKWQHPVPEKVTTNKVDGKEVHSVQTRLNGQRIDFELDKRSNLPVKVGFFVPNIGVGGEHLSYEVYLADYMSQDGVMVPTIVNGDKTTYRFNTPYNEEIFFKAPLPIETAADAWKKK